VLSGYHHDLVNLRAILTDNNDLALVMCPDLDCDLSGDIVRDFFGLVLGTVHANDVWNIHPVDNIEMKSGHLVLRRGNTNNLVLFRGAAQGSLRPFLGVSFHRVDLVAPQTAIFSPTRPVSHSQ
jgi:hypothetical protein